MNLDSWVPFPALPLAHCLAMVKLLPQFPQICKMETIGRYHDNRNKCAKIILSRDILLQKARQHLIR